MFTRAWKAGGFVKAFAALAAIATIGVPAAQSGPAPVIGAGVHEGSKSGLPVPRFVSLKSARVNVRVGPGEDYKIAWIFTRSALPVEVIQEYDTWRRIRDSDGTVGWVFQSLLSGKRTAVVAPWTSGDPRPVYSSASSDASVVAYLQPGVMGQIDRCHASWCRISSTQYSGWIPQDQLWGTYQGEEVN
jgi:SH3-like domain-containing protein